MADFQGSIPFRSRQISTSAEIQPANAPPEFITPEPATLTALTLSQAVPIWQEIRKQRGRLRERTHESTAGHFSALEKVFGSVRLKDITAGQLREYQIGRGLNLMRTERGEIHPWHKAAGHSTINHELASLGKLLHHCGLWARLKLYYAPLSIPAWSPREILDKEDEERLFKSAAGHPEAELAFRVACITNNTSASGCELRGLRLKHLIFRKPSIDENGTDQTPCLLEIPPEIVKNNNRPRQIPLNPAALWAVDQCYKRALKCGSCKPDDYLFPLRVRQGKWDPTRPSSRSWLRKSWQHLIRIANTPGLRPHDLRHLFITRMLEDGHSPDVLRAVCGHVTPKMTEYYSHFRMEAKTALVNGVPPHLAAENAKNYAKQRTRSSRTQDSRPPAAKSGSLQEREREIAAKEARLDGLIAAAEQRLRALQSRARLPRLRPH
jgi:integrase